MPMLPILWAVGGVAFDLSIHVCGWRHCPVRLLFKRRNVSVFPVFYEHSEYSSFSENDAGPQTKAGCEDMMQLIHQRNWFII